MCLDAEPSREEEGALEEGKRGGGEGGSTESAEGLSSYQSKQSFCSSTKKFAWRISSAIDIMEC